MYNSGQGKNNFHTSSLFYCSDTKVEISFIKFCYQNNRSVKRYFKNGGKIKFFNKVPI